MTTKTWKFTVSGRGAFPLDMLRYDQATVVDGTLDEIGASFENRNEAAQWMRRYTVNLRSYSYSGPTTARWNSFGWLVTDIEKER